MKLALCGNPNVGKTSLYNRLTRSDAPVGNWHGVTVDVTQKRIRGTDVILSDLPGSYSLTARTADEAVARDSVLFGDYDAIVCVAEVNNLRRNLYLLMQILEAGKRAILIVNMMDEARGKVDLRLLSERLGIPVVGASDKRENPKAAILDAARNARSVVLPYMRDSGIVRRAKSIERRCAEIGLGSGFCALKIMERDGFIAEKIGATDITLDADCPSACPGCNASSERDIPAELRYAYIDRVLDGVTEHSGLGQLTEKIDRVVLGKFALPIFFLVMTAVFVITFEVGKPLSTLLTRLIAAASTPVRNADMPEWVCDFLCDGIIGGVGAVLAFLPQVVLLFFMTALLQDSGYMSRVAFVTDGFFRRFGLSGRAAFSLILGFGCSATAVLSSRGIADAGARRRTAFVTPFVPCSARLSVFTAVTAYFGLSGFVVGAMYALGFVTALTVLKISKHTLKSDGGEQLLMEIPKYRVPSLRRIALSVFRDALSFICRVGSVVLGVNAIMWILSEFSFANGYGGDPDSSIMSTFAGIIAPVFKPLGFGDWRAVTALISGVAAKETLISVITSLGGMDALFPTRVAAVSFLIFSCLYVPCIATIAALTKELGAKWALCSIAVHTVTAYVASLVFYGMANLFVIDKRLFYTVCAVAAIALAVALILRRICAAKKTKAKTGKGKVWGKR